MPERQIDCIVRFHDFGRLKELERCIFSLVGQSYRPLNIILVLQRFSEAEIGATQLALASMLRIPDAPKLTIRNFEQAMPKDCRTLLLNLGLEAAEGRYLGFLDYDDLLYPQAHRVVISRLQETNAAVAFASVRVVLAEVYPQFIRILTERREPFGPGKCLADLFRSNFCPIHSFVMDRHQISLDDLFFDPHLTREEDYDLLLRICAKYPSDFGLLNVKVGDYFYKTDGSNSVPFDGNVNDAQVDNYELISSIIEACRRITVVSPAVQAKSGIIPPESGMTISRFLDRMAGAS
jgi:hypothetical protein